MRKVFVYSCLIFIVSCNVREQRSVGNISLDLGIRIDSAFGGSCPFVFKAADSTIIVSWLRDISDTQAVLCFAVAKNGTDFESTVIVPGSDNAHPHGENLPRVIVTPNGKILAAWGASNPNPKNPYSGIVYYSWSLDGGKNWTTPTTLSRDTNSIDQRYFDVEILKDNTVGVIWLDNRKNTEKEGSSLYFATFNDRNVLDNERAIDATCCQCCRTDLFMDKQGNLHTVYRKIINDSIRDMVHAFSSDNGKTFSEPRRISPDNWVINGCPHSGPAIAQTSEGLSFVWYTLGNGSGVFYADSKDNGKTFSERNTISVRPSAKHPQITVVNEKEQAIVWDEGTATGSRIGFELRSASGEKIESTYITDSLNHASFPVIKSVSEGIIVAYTVKGKSGEGQKVYYKVIKSL